MTLPKKEPKKVVRSLLTLLAIVLPYLPCQASTSLAITGATANPQTGVVIYASALGPEGRPVRGLSSTSFSALIGGKPTPVASVNTIDDGSPIAVVLAMDVSRSMAGRPMRCARDAACAFATRLAKDDQASLVSFGRSPHLLADYTSDKEHVGHQIRGLSPAEQGTVLNSSVAYCARLAEKSRLPRVAVVLLSDGRDEGSQITLDQAIAETEKSVVPFYTIAYGAKADRRALARISRLTGGRFAIASTPDQAYGLYDTILGELKNQYAITLKGPIPSGRQHVKLVLAEGDTLHTAARNVFVPYTRESAARKKHQALAISGLVAVFLVVTGMMLGSRIKRRDVGPKNDFNAFEGGSAMQNQSGDARVVWQSLGVGERRSGLSDVPMQGTGQVWIEVASGPHKGMFLRLTGSLVHIGRDSRSELALVADQSVSRRHAQIAFGDDGFFSISDLNSARGTKLNDNDLGGRPARLRDGDRIAVGGSDLIYRDDRARFKSA